MPTHLLLPAKKLAMVQLLLCSITKESSRMAAKSKELADTNTPVWAARSCSHRIGVLGLHSVQSNGGGLHLSCTSLPQPCRVSSFSFSSIVATAAADRQNKNKNNGENVLKSKIKKAQQPNGLMTKQNKTNKNK